MGYKVPDGWPVPNKITWYTCNRCGMIYGDGEFNQAMLDEFYTKYYGYGVSNPDNTTRLMSDAAMISREYYQGETVVDFGGADDEGSTLVRWLEKIAAAYPDTHKIKAVCIGPNDPIPQAHVIYASHVLEHIYDLPKTMKRITEALAPDGLLIVDVPDANGLLNRWKMPILDFNTKHLNHFTLRNLLDLGRKYGFESVYVKPYELEYAPCYQVHFRRMDVARHSALHISESMYDRKKKLKAIDYPVNVWGLGDVVWHMLTLIDLNVLDYIDNDPAMRGQTYNGKPIIERPTNDAPIVILAQGQRSRLLAYIKSLNLPNEVIEI